MEAFENEFSVLSTAKILKVSRSRFYLFKKRSKNVIDSFSQSLLADVKTIWIENKRAYGLKKIHILLRKIHPKVGARRLRKVMNCQGIRGKQGKCFKIGTTDSKHNNRVAPDLVQRNFIVSKPNEVWVADVTFLSSKLGWLYLCVIIDLYSRKVVGWSVSVKNDSRLVCDTLHKAILKRNPPKGLIFHSDRGSNYSSKETRLKLIGNLIRRSNSRKGNCWDNSVAESFFGSLKREMEYNHFHSLSECEYLLFDHIEVFYNRQRIHSTLNYKTPESFKIK